MADISMSHFIGQLLFYPEDVQSRKLPSSLWCINGYIPILFNFIHNSLTCVFSLHLSPLNDDAWMHETSFTLKRDMKQCRFWWRWQLITAGSALVLTAVESLCLHMCTLLIQLSLQSSSTFFLSDIWYLFNNLQSKHSVFILCTVFIWAECVYIIYSLFASVFFWYSDYKQII